MNKAFKRYGKARWINTRFSRRYKFERLMARIASAQIAAASIARNNQIRFASTQQSNKVSKACHMADNIINTTSSIAKRISEPEKKWRAA